jgi:alkanesulfonate monooxygenase SsuD/methylene tetrahydromethanopterin reductase-like flavin-dependent oxidoreductase (luciferase family)
LNKVLEVAFFCLCEKEEDIGQTRLADGRWPAFREEKIMRVGINIGFQNIHQKSVGDVIAHIAEQADQAGFATLVMPDHFSLRPESTPFIRREQDSPTPVVNDFFEAWSTLAFIAARTKHIRLSTLVSGITMRYPAVLIKMADTLDALSNGRAYLGIGASPNFGEDEHQRMGLPFPPAGERIARLEEVLQMALQLWSGEDKPFQGKYYQLTSTVGTPFFIQKPHPPILIAGNGNKMLRIMAKYADAINIGFNGELDDLREKLNKLREHCQELNRSYEHIQKTTFFMRPMIRDGHLDPAVIESIAALADLGFDEIIIRHPSDPAVFELLATELLPAVAKLPVKGA